MRPRFAGADPNAARAYQPTSINDALYPSNRKYFYYTPTQERKGLPCPIGMREGEGFRPKVIPAIHLLTRRRDAVPSPQQQAGGAQAPPQPTSLKGWSTMTNDTDAILASSAATSKAALNLMLSEYRANMNSHATNTPADTAEQQELLSMISGTSQPSHCTDFVKSCIYGPGGSSCSAVPSELFPDTYLFLSRRGYCAPIVIEGGGGEGGDDGGASGGTVRATHTAMLNPLLDPTMSCVAVDSMLPSELRIYRTPDGAATSTLAGMGAAEEADNNNNNNDDGTGEGCGIVGHGSHKASSSSSFLFSRNAKSFRIKPPSRPVRIEKPVRRGAVVVMGGRTVPSQGGKAVGGATGSKPPTAGGRGRGRKGADGRDDDDLTLAEAFGGGAAGRPAVAAEDEDDFAIVDPKAGAKRGRDGQVVLLPDGTEDPNARVDDGGDGADSNGDADTNSLSSFSGDDDDNDDMSDGGGDSDGELYL